MDTYANQKLFRLMQRRYGAVQTALKRKKYEQAIDRYLDVCSTALEIEHPSHETFYDAPQFHFYRGPVMQTLWRDCVSLDGVLQEINCDLMLLGFADNIPSNKKIGYMEREETKYFLDGVIMKGKRNARKLFQGHRQLIEQMIGFRTFEKYVRVRGILLQEEQTFK